MFPTTCATVYLRGPTRAGDRHTMPARSPSIGGLPSKAIELPGIVFATLGVSPADRLGQNPYHPSKVTNISLIKSPLHLYETSGLLPLNTFVLKPLTNSYNQDPAAL